MNCALELNIIKEAKIEADRLENLRLDEECRRNFENIVADTIKYCEGTVNDKLTEAAASGRNICYYFTFAIDEDRLGHKIAHPLVKGEHYANGTPSYKPDTSVTYSVDTLLEYPNAFCINTKMVEYKYKKYGVGVMCNGREIAFSA